MPKQTKKSKLRLLRVSVASVVFAIMTLLFLDHGGHLSRVLGWLPKIQFWPAVLAINVASLVLIIALTMLFGRVYCSFICPLGIMQDGIYRIRIAGKKKNRFMQGYSPAKNILRYSILSIFIVLICLGYGSFAYLIEPYSIFGRMITSVIGKALPIALISLGTFILIAILVLRGGRTWCNTICPVGSILGLLSARSLFRPVIKEDSCTNCGLCGKGCRASCIDTENHRVDTSRCVVCFDCIDNCSSDAIEYKFDLKAAMGAGNKATMVDGNKTAKVSAETGAKAETKVEAGKQAVHKVEDEKQPADQSRRAFIAASALAIGSLAAKAQEGHGDLAPLKERTAPDRQSPVVPAGASSLKSFNDHCVACQLCVEACPNNVLSPDLSLGRFMKPKMDFDKGFCRPECIACARVCPAGAIVKLEPEEKTAVSIGHAVYNVELCVVTTDEVDCGNCARHCPAGAISMVKSEEHEGRRIPAVNPERCIGCGHCEYVCPSRPISAIHVEGNLVHRSI